MLSGRCLYNKKVIFFQGERAHLDSLVYPNSFSIRGKEMNITDTLALWGALVATGVLAWDFFKWKTEGPRIRIFANANFKVLGDESLEGKTFISIDIMNIGGGASTIQKIGFVHFKNKWMRLFRRRSGPFYWVVKPHSQHGLPHFLESGKFWSGLANQNEELENLSQKGLVHLAVQFTHKDNLMISNNRIDFSLKPSKPI